MQLLTREGTDEGEDPDPAPAPATSRPLYVPVRLGSSGGSQVRFARTPLGARTAVAFTSVQRLAAAFGERQPWVTLSEPALRALAEPLGAYLVTVDPRTGPVSSGHRALGAQVSPADRNAACARRTQPAYEAVRA